MLRPKLAVVEQGDLASGLKSGAAKAKSMPKKTLTKSCSLEFFFLNKIKTIQELNQRFNF